MNIYKVNCLVREDPIEEGDLFDELLGIDLKTLEDICDSICVHKRSKYECPLGRGNWIIDLYHGEQVFLCVKLPLETEESRIKEFMKNIFKIYPANIDGKKVDDFKLDWNYREVVH